MRLIKVVTIISIIFLYGNFAQSNDIRDFEINGINIGDSLLDYYTKEEIESSTKTNYPNQKFYDIHISAESDQYDQYTYTVKNADNYFATDDLIDNTELETDDGVAITDYLIICNSGIDCDEEPQMPAYMVVWSRFGNISKFKYNSSNEWIRQ